MAVYFLILIADYIPWNLFKHFPPLKTLVSLIWKFSSGYSEVKNRSFRSIWCSSDQTAMHVALVGEGLVSGAAVGQGDQEEKDKQKKRSEI